MKSKKHHENQTESAPETIQDSAEPAAEILDEKQIEIDTIRDQLLRTAAEYDNYRKRTAKEMTELSPVITMKVMTKFLPVLDNIERALAAETTDESFKKGVELIAESFREMLKDSGLEEIDTSGAFDHNLHQAVQKVPSADESQVGGNIAQTFQKGYKLGEKVLRYSMVSVYE